MAKKRKKSTKKESVYVALHNPGNLRASFLESRKNCLEAMRIFQEIRHIRKKKGELNLHLRKQIRIVSSTMHKLSSLLPKVPYREDKPAPPPKKEDPKPKVAPHPRTEMDKIERGLQDIEQKLTRLSQS